MQKILLILCILFLTGCAGSTVIRDVDKPLISKNLMQKEFDMLPAPHGKKISVAVYSFSDKTGQRKPSANIAQLSTAVTQGADAFLIKALQDVGRGNT